MTTHMEVAAKLEKGVKVPVKRALLVALIGVVAVAYMLVSYYSREHLKSERPVPPVLVGAAPLQLSADDTFQQAEKFADQNQVDKGIPELLSVAQFSTNQELRARALLHAATLLNMADENSDDARQLYEFFLKSNLGQPGTDVAHFHLAMFALKHNQPAMAEFHLISLLRENPDSNLKSSALFVAGEASELLKQSESDSADSFPWPNLGASVLVTALGLYLTLRQHIRRGNKEIISLCIVVVIVTAFMTYRNDRELKRSNQELYERVAKTVSLGR